MSRTGGQAPWPAELLELVTSTKPELDGTRRRLGELSPARARQAFADVEFHPDVLRPAVDVDTSVQVLGGPSALPSGISPTGFTQFQLYVVRDRSISYGLVERAAAAGFDTPQFTVDAPIPGARLRDERDHALTSADHFDDAAPGLDRGPIGSAGPGGLPGPLDRRPRPGREGLRGDRGAAEVTATLSDLGLSTGPAPGTGVVVVRGADFAGIGTADDSCCIA